LNNNNNNNNNNDPCHHHPTSLLIESIFKNDIDRVYQLLKQKNYLLHHRKDYHSITPFTPLILAYLLNRPTIFKILIRYSNLNELDDYNFNILHYAIFKEDITMIKYLGSRLTNVNFTVKDRSNNHSVLQMLIQFNKMEFFSMLFWRCKSISFQEVNGEEEMILSSFIKKTQKFDIRELKIVMQILQKGCNVIYGNKRRKSALMYAIDCDSLPLVKMLLRYKKERDWIRTKVNPSDREEDDYKNDTIESLLYYALENGSSTMIEYFVKTNYEFFNNKKFIEDTIHHDQSNILKSIIPFVSIKEVLDYKIMKVIVDQNKINFIKVLVPTYVDVNMDFTDYHMGYFTLLTYSIEVKKIKISKYLIDHCTDIHLKHNLMSPLLTAITNNNDEIVKYLLDSGVSLLSDESIIFRAIGSKIHNDTIKRVIDYNADIDQKDINQFPLLYIALFRRNLEIIKYLIEKGLHINVEYDWYCPYKIKSYAGYDNIDNMIKENIIAILIKNGVGESQSNGSPIVVFIHRHHMKIKNIVVTNDSYDRVGSFCFDPITDDFDKEIIQYLLRFATPTTSKDTEQYQTKEINLEDSIKNGQLEMVQHYLQQGGSINVRNKDGDTPLILALKFQKWDIAKFLVDQRADVNVPLDEKQRNRSYTLPLNLAVKAGNLDMTKYLIEHGALINEFDNREYTPLITAIDENHFKLVQYLIDSGANVNIKGPIITASTTSLKMVKYLIKYGALLTYTSENLRNDRFEPVYTAYRSNQIKIAKYLIEKSANINYEFTENLLFDALDHKRLGFVKFLISSGKVNPYFYDISCDSPLRHAISSTNILLMEYIIKDNFTIVNTHYNDRIEDTSSDLPLNCGISTGDVTTVQYLLKKGADIFYSKENDNDDYHKYYSPYDTNNIRNYNERNIENYYKIKNVLEEKIKKLEIIKKETK